MTIFRGKNTNTFDDLIGLKEVKEFIRDRQTLMESNLSFAPQNGIGILLYGFPGTGKSAAVHAIANELNIPLYQFSLWGTRGKETGDPAERLRQLFDEAHANSASLICFEDLHDYCAGLLKDRVQCVEFVTELICQMGKIYTTKNNIWVLATSNKPWLIDPALLRSGRFGNHIYVPLHNHQERVLLVEKELKSVPVDRSVEVDRISDLMKGYTSVDIVSVVSQAKMAAINRTMRLRDGGQQECSPVSFDDFAEVMANYKRMVEPEDVVQMRRFAMKIGQKLSDEM